MITLAEAQERVTKLWGKQAPKAEETYRLMKYVLRVEHEGHTALHNVMTGQLILLNEDEIRLLDALPTKYSQAMEALVADHPFGRVYKGEIESILLLRKIADRLVDFDTILMHGAVIAVDGEAYLFTAPSGTGKTTHIRRWLENMPDAYVVNGDKPLIVVGDTPMACGTPWCGKERMGTNAIVPLKAIVMMKRSEDNSMRPMSFIEAFPRLMEQTHRPADTDKMRKTVRLLSELSKHVALWQFEFNNFKDDTFEVAYHALTSHTCK